MKKVWMIVVILVALVIVSLILNLNKETYLNENTLNYIMYDYNYLTGNTEEITKEYFAALKSTAPSYSVDKLKEMGVYDTEPRKVVLNIQANYKALIANTSQEEKQELDKYLLENSLKYYSEELAK